MMDINVFILFIVTHWIADFIFQDEKWVLGKSKSLTPLLKHTTTYSLIWVVVMYIFTFNLMGSITFGLITLILHTLTDYYTSRIVSKKFAHNQIGSPIPNIGAFTIIGFDQVLHYVQLLLTYKLLFT